MKKVFLMGMMACFSFLLCLAQPVLKTSANKNGILIGEQFEVKIAADFLPDAYKINWPTVPDSLGHFEVISRGKIDSSYNNGGLTALSQTFTLTSFDSGKWAVPSFLINATAARGDTTFHLFTDSLPMTVSFSTTDTTNQLRDIKPIREVLVKSSPWFWIGAAILIIALIVLVIWLYRRRKKKKAIATPAARITPYEEALKDLDSLRTYNLTSPQEIKTMHTRLSEILKRYLSRTERSDYSNRTTSDILMLLRDRYPSEITITRAAATLRCGDAVKFAKYLPAVNESEECLQSARAVIDEIHRQIQHSRPATVNTKS